MIIQEFQNNLNSNFFSLNQIPVQFVHYFSIFLVNLVSYLYILIKLFKVLCYSKMTFEWLPMVNPYVWPFSFFQMTTNSYFQFWAKIFPTVKFENSSLEISGILALEILNSLLYFCIRLTQSLLIVLEETEKLMISK